MAYLVLDVRSGVDDALCVMDVTVVREAAGEGGVQTVTDVDVVETTWHKQTVFNSLANGRCGSYFTIVYFKLTLGDDALGYSREIACSWMPQNHLRQVNVIGSGNGLVPSGSKLLP